MLHVPIRGLLRIGVALIATSCATRPVFAQITQVPPEPDRAVSVLTSPEVQRYAENSAWAAQERQAFTALLTGSHFEWLVAPTQVQRNALDQRERSMISAELVRTLTARGQSVADSYLVERALGEGQRETSLVDIDALSRLIGAKTVLVPYVGHDNAQHLTLTLTIYRKPEPGKLLFEVRPTYLTVHDLPVGHTRAPIEGVARALPELLSALGVPLERPATTGVAPKPLPIPDMPDQLVAPGRADPLADAARLAILAELAPPWTLASDRLAERCLVATRLAPSIPAQRFLMAYALFRLNLRPEALPVLSAATSPGLTALTAIINGNYTGTAALVGKTRGYERLILEFQLHALARIYKHDDGADLSPWLDALAQRSGAWRVLLERRWVYRYLAGSQSNVALERLLDALYPVNGQSLGDLAAGQAATPGLPHPGLDLELSVLRHVRALMTQQRATWCCLPSPTRPNAWDLVNVIAAWAEFDLLDAIDDQLSVKELPENARQMLTDLDPYLAGRADFEILHERADFGLMATLPEAQQGPLRASARDHVLRALAAAGGQTYEALSAREASGSDPLAMSIAGAYASDYPLNPDWFGTGQKFDPKDRLTLEREALARSQIGVAYAGMLYREGGPTTKAEVKMALQSRFQGNPDREAVHAMLHPASLSVTAYITQLKLKVQTEPDNWQYRSDLSDALLMHDDILGAAKVVVDYPLFHQANPDEPIGLSNDAAEAGHNFYWRGAEAQARQLYHIATQYHVGSEGEMAAQMHLALLDGNLNKALQVATARAARYRDGVSYYFYLSLLHLIGRSDEAWKAFNTLLGQPLGFAPWESALVGLRMAGTTPEQLDAWIARPDISAAGTRADSWPAQFMLVWSTTDGRAPPDLTESIEKLDHEPRGTTEDIAGRMASYPSEEPDGVFMTVRSNFRADQRRVLPYGTPVDSHQALFARALVAMQRGDYAAAVQRFDDLAARYSIEQPMQRGDAVYALSEFALVSAKTGDPLHLEAFLDTLPSGTTFFELSLARAYFQALVHHDNAAALGSLQQAFRFIDSYLGRTPSMQYLYADTAERLFIDTKDERFRDKAVTWAHEMQRLQPWAAWSYAIEAELAPDAGVRRQALVRALFLDPLSPRLQTVPPADLDYAKDQLKKRANPFLGAPEHAPPDTTTASVR